MTDALYEKFVQRWEEVTDLPPQTVGRFTPWYKAFVKHVKIMPWPVLVVFSVVIVGGLYILSGSTITLLVNILQRGF